MEDFMKHMQELRMGGKYQLVCLLGAGTFGKVYAGRNVDTDEGVAVKLEHHKVDPSLLEQEVRLYERLAPQPGFPRVYWHGWKGDFRVMVFELLGPNLQDLFVYCGKKFSLKTTLMLADQLLCRMEALHSTHILHRDIKPENFLLGVGTEGNRVYVTDLGLAIEHRRRRINNQCDAELSDREQHSSRVECLVGTCRYASVNGHFGKVQARDDLESLGYMLVYFMKGSLPWQGLRASSRSIRYSKVLEMKRSLSVSDLCKGLPAAFTEYMTYVKSLSATEVPGYRYLRDRFHQLFQQQRFEYDDVYDWTIHEFQKLA